MATPFKSKLRSQQTRSSDVHPNAEIWHVYRVPPPDGVDVLPELSQVTILTDAKTIEGDHVAAGTEGTIVSIWRNGEAYEVEFLDALGTATIAAADLRPA